MEEKELIEKALNIEKIRCAAERIRSYIRRTPLLRERSMDESLNCRVWLKPEMLQISGAFKMRGALNKILGLTQEEREKGIICSSSGNHGKACALIGKMLGIRVIVVLPEDVPKAKIGDIERLGAEVLIGPRIYDERWRMVREEVAKHGYTIVHAYEDYEVMAGQGTLGLEIMEDMPGIDTVIVPVGGGGLLSGVATAVKTLKPSVKVVGIQAKGNDGYVQSMKAGHPVEVELTPTIADGLTARKPGINPYPILEKYVDEWISVGEDDIRKAVRLIASEAKLMAEPSSSVGIAALLSGEYKAEPDENVAFVLTSGNWDIDRIGDILCGGTGIK